ncbi:MAG: extracellular solute-binding protein [Rhodoferax sp.]|uniref:extracellular solute-binding protein n=1 Tax=Rhodoferax sp. TaxID=50421 RepID=UPI00140064E9|nr:extracellular solute-binding protein [Rhodoferax sp.]NDP37855.1 extracellular solute-binding protein [Rhodoferax sp.]
MNLRLLLLLIVALTLSLPGQAVETLRVLAWPGYADVDLVKVFEKQQGVRVEVSFVSSDDVLRQKISANQGGDFDVFAANTAEIQHYIDERLVVPLRLANIPNTAHQLPRFRKVQSIPGITRLGEVYAVPYTYSEMGLIFDRKQFKQAPTSLAVMWDPQYKGRVLAFDTSSHNFSIASLVLGGKPFQIEDKDFKNVVNHLIALRRNVLTFYTLPEESVELFRHHSAALLFANYGRQQLKLLRDAGADVGYVIPQEGALAWLDCWALTRGVKNKKLAESWINFMLDKKVSSELTRRQGLSNTIEVDPETANADKIIWIEPVEGDKRRSALWGRIISGDLPGRF